jgi:hypothetical protein
MIAVVTVYGGLGGMLVLARWGWYGNPWWHLVLWAASFAVAYAITVRTRGPGPLPLLMVAAMLVTYVVSSLDLRVPAGVIPFTWAQPMLGASLGVVVFTGPLWRGLLLLAGSITVLELLIVRHGMNPTLQGPGALGPLLGVFVAIGVMLVLRRRAERTALQRRSLATVRESARAVRDDRSALLQPVLCQAIELLDGLSTGQADPDDPEIRAACAAAERRLRAALLAATNESELSLLAQRLLGTRADVELVVQGDESWDELPAAVRAAVADLLHRVLDDPATKKINITALPDDGRIWLSLTCDGGTPPDALPIDLPRPAARGADGGQWWLEWTLRPEPVRIAPARPPIPPRVQSNRLVRRLSAG